MRLKIHYDEETTKILDNLRDIWKEYCELLKPIHKARTTGWSHLEDIKEDFDKDWDKVRIERQMIKVEQLAIPVKVEFILDSGEKFDRTIRDE